MKPKKNEMQAILLDLMDELSLLEKGISATLRTDEQTSSETVVKMFLLACVCDKPATSLLLHLNKSTRYFGCTKCTIKGRVICFSSSLKCCVVGVSVNVGGSSIRSFTYNPNEKLTMRSNQTHDKAVQFLANGSGSFKLNDSLLCHSHPGQENF